ncbi:MAG: hypothetical protein Ta2F_01380 [Termitinemataceae bacterium]|nr:MAG: hypothetical protein Ta2F_01380 [Termitinemataceae bacterium]
MKNTKEPKEHYIPELGIKYPEDPSEHMDLKPPKVDFVLDEDYPFLNRSFGFKLIRFFIDTAIICLVFPLCSIRYDLRIEGRENLKKYKKELKDGALVVCNHVQRWDFLFIRKAIRYRTLNFPAWPHNLRGSDRHVIRLVGGIPVPDKLSLMKKFNAVFDKLHEEKRWLSVFPESASWHYYPYIRPFKKGMFTMAQKYNIPVLPLAISWRPPYGIFKLYKKGMPLATIRIGEPIYLNSDLNRKDAVQDLRKRTHQKIVELAGIKNNPFPAEGD